MSNRTWTGYIPSGYLNSAASQVYSGSVDAETGAVLPTGLVLGAMTEYGAGTAASFSNPNATTYPYTLYDGTYCWVELDPAVTGSALGIGTVVYWKASTDGGTSNSFQVTTTASGNFPDYAGVVIDPNFGPLNASGGIYPYAFIQINGKCSALFASSVTNGGTLAFGDLIGLKSGSLDFDDIAAEGGTVTGYVLGIALAAPAVSVVSAVRIYRPPVRF
jgi:hypothetical protein